MPVQKPLEFKHLRPWETVAEAVWKRYPAAARFPERKQLDVTSKRLNATMTEAVVERTVTYNFSEVIPLILKAVVGGGESFVMRETLTFDWQQRRLHIESVNETASPQVKYTERVTFGVHPDNELHTLMRQTGHYEVDVMFGMHQMGVSMCEDIYQLCFTHNRDADMSLMEEFARAASKEVVGHFPSYLRKAFLQDHAPAQLPPPPSVHGTASAPSVGGGKAGGAEAPKSEPFKLDLAMDADEARRKLAWMFAPTPPLTKSVRAGKPESVVDAPSRLGKKGAAYACMQPNFCEMHTFTRGALAGPVPPPLEIYGVAREAAGEEGKQRGAGGGGASSLVMF